MPQLLLVDVNGILSYAQIVGDGGESIDYVPTNYTLPVGFPASAVLSHLKGIDNQFPIGGGGGGGGSGYTTISESPPASPVQGQKWYQPSTGIEFTRYVDADSAQWIETGNTGSPTAIGASFQPPGTGTVVRTYSDVLDEVVGISVFNYIPESEHAGITNGAQTYDCTAAIQAAVDAAIYHTKRGKVILPPGFYKVSNTIHLGYGLTYSNVFIEGAGSLFAAENGFSGTAIIATFNDRPVFNFQGGRASSLKKMSISGTNFNHIYLNGYGSVDGTTNGSDDLVAANWVLPAFPAASSSRYAPYAAITIDAYAGARPAVSYPDVTYPAFLGATVQYNKTFSSQILIEDVEIKGFVVGVAQQPCDADGNADYTKLNRVVIGACQYGMSIGQTQSRLVHFNDCLMGRVHTCIVTTKHGRLAGKPQFLAESCEFGQCIKILDCPTTDYGGGPHFINCYGEVIYSIGNCGTGASSNAPVKFDHCEFGFHGQQNRGAPAYLFSLNGTGQARFEQCSFGAGQGTYAFFGQNGAQNYSFVECQFPVDDLDSPSLATKIARQATCNIVFSKLTTNLTEFSGRTPYFWDLDTGANTSPRIVQELNNGARPYGVPVYSKKVKGNLLEDTGADVYLGAIVSKDKTGVSFTTSGRDVTFNTAYPVWSMKQYGGDVGDIVWDDVTGATFYITNRTGSTIKMRAMSGFNGAGNLLTAMSATGNLYFLNCRSYSPPEVMYGNSTGNATLTNVFREDTAPFIGNGTTGAIRIGDVFRVFNKVNAIIPENFSEILAVDGTLGTITLVTNGGFQTATHRRYPLLARSGPSVPV